MDDVKVCEGCGAEFEVGGLVEHDGRNLCSACIQDDEGLELDEEDDDGEDVDSDLVIDNEDNDDD